MGLNPKELYEQGIEKDYASHIKENVENVMDLLATGQLDRKIQNFCDKYKGCLDIEQVKNSIRNDPVVRCFFAKDPIKQNFFENYAAKWIRGLSGVEDFKHLSKKSLVLTQEGAVQEMSEFSRSGARTKAKSIDFTFWVHSIHFYVSHKCIRESGGSQDNQYRDLELFLEHARSSRPQIQGERRYFLAFCDGEYFDFPSKGNGETRLEALRRIHVEHVFVMRTWELGLFLSSLKETMR